MRDTLRTALALKVTASISDAQQRLKETQKLLRTGDELAALGALSGIAARVQYAETLLTVLRDLELGKRSAGPRPP